VRRFAKTPLREKEAGERADLAIFTLNEAQNRVSVKTRLCYFHDHTSSLIENRTKPRDFEAINVCVIFSQNDLEPLQVGGKLILVPH